MRSGRTSWTWRRPRCGRPAWWRRDIAAIGITNQRETTVLWERPAAAPAPRHRLAGPAHGRGLRPLKPKAPRRWCRRRPAWCSTPISRPPSWPGCSTTCRARARANAASWLSAPSTAGWPGTSPAAAARHRPHERLAHLAVRHPHAATGTRNCWRCSASRASAAARRALQRAVRRDRAGLFGARSPRRHGRRPAGGPLRPGLPRRRHGEEHLRHRLLPADATRRPGGRLEPTGCSPPARRRPGDAPEYALEGSVFIAGAAVQWLRDGLGLIRRRPTSRRWPPACRTPAAWSSCRPSPGSARRTGTRMRAACWRA
jgi:hypothetical protein